MLFYDLGKAPCEPFVRLGLGFQHLAGKDHVILMFFHHFSHARVGGRTDARHG